MEDLTNIEPSRSAIVGFPLLRARLRPEHRGEERAAILRLRLLPAPPFTDPRQPRPAA